MYVCMYGVPPCVYGDQGQLVGVGFSPSSMQVQVIRLGRKCLYLMSHLAGSLYFILVTVINSTAIQLQRIKLDHAGEKCRMMGIS